MRLPFQLRIGCWETKNLAGISHWVMLTLYRKATRHLSSEFLLSFSTWAFKVHAHIFLIEITQRKMVRSVCLKPVSRKPWRLHTLWRFTFTAYTKVRYLSAYTYAAAHYIEISAITCVCICNVCTKVTHTTFNRWTHLHIHCIQCLIISGKSLTLSLSGASRKNRGYLYCLWLSVPGKRRNKERKEKHFLSRVDILARLRVIDPLFFFSGRTSFNLSLPLHVHLDAHVFTID